MITIIIRMCNNRMRNVTNRREASPRRRNASICGRLAFGTWINDGHARTHAAPLRLPGPAAREIAYQMLGSATTTPLK